jgi:hypothetical protein
VPDITPETTRSEITIAGKTFTVPAPYTEGHVLTANEASSLNQTFAENLRNNFAKRVKEADEAGTFDADMLQSQFDDYAAEYEFGVRTAGARSSDPVASEAMSIMKEQVRIAIQRGGKKLKDYTTAQISGEAKRLLALGNAASEAVMALARQRVEASQGLSGLQIDSLQVGEGEAPAEAPKAKKAKAAEPA